MYIGWRNRFPESIPVLLKKFKNTITGQNVCTGRRSRRWIGAWEGHKYREVGGGRGVKLKGGGRD